MVARCVIGHLLSLHGEVNYYGHPPPGLFICRWWWQGLMRWNAFALCATHSSCPFNYSMFEQRGKHSSYQKTLFLYCLKLICSVNKFKCKSIDIIHVKIAENIWRYCSMNDNYVTKLCAQRRNGKYCSRMNVIRSSVAKRLSSDIFTLLSAEVSIHRDLFRHVCSYF